MPPLLLFQRKVILLVCVLLINVLLVQAQRIKNPSFEGRRGEDIIPPMWSNCGPASTPDTQPGAWYVTLPPAHGNSYLGMVCRDSFQNGTFESITQELNYPFHKDSCYTFDISLAYDPDYDHPGTRKPAILRLWGGNNLCATVENLWNSPAVDHKEWRTYQVSFSPTETHHTITLQAYFAAFPFYHGAVLIDHIRNIQAFPKPSFSMGNDTTICGNSELILDASTASGPFLWQDGSTGSTFTVTKTGRYWVQTYMGGCKVADTINVVVDEPMEVDLGPDQTICNGDQIMLSLDLFGATYQWSDGTTNAYLNIRKTGKYWVEVSRSACVQSDTINVTVNDCRFFIPNVITPNGDELNETFEIIDDFDHRWSLSVYNRWGQLIFYDEEYKNTWKGDGVRNGVYFYVLKSHTSGQIFRGTLTLTR